MSLILAPPQSVRAPLAWRAGFRSAAVPLLGLLLLFAVWAVGGWIIAHNPATVAFAGFAPLPTLRRLGEMLADGTIARAVSPSAIRIAAGLGAAIVVGVPVGILIGQSRFFRELTHLPFQLLRMVSPLAWMPIAILAFPTWDGAIIFLIAAAAIWPIIFATANGLKKLDPDWFKVARNLGADFWYVLTAVIVPATAQDILTGIRLALGVAWIVLVPAEYLGVTSGLGYAISDARDTMEYDRLGAFVLVIGVMGFLLDAFLLLLIKRVSWTGHD
jgi:NitT/TauT family transport system permease protein